jgi:predicted nucleic acid-binding protein
VREGWVVDASVAIAWIHPAQATDATNNLREKLKTGWPLVVPVVWFHETANALLVLERRKRLKPQERTQALLALRSLNLKVDQDGVSNVFSRTSELAEKHGLSVYNATYLELAAREQLPLAIQDPPLREAALSCGVELLLK